MWIRNRVAREFLIILQDISYSLTRVADSIGGTLDGNIVKKLEELKSIMATKADVQAALDAVLTEVAKIGDDLSAHLADLEAKIAAGEDVTDLLTKSQEVATKLQEVDDLVPEKAQG